MNDFILMLPTLVSMLAGLLLAWTCLNLYELINTIIEVNHQGRKARRCDYLNVGVMLAAGAAMLISMFVTPAWTLMMAEIVAVLEIWYLVFLINTTSSVIFSHYRVKNRREGRAEVKYVHNEIKKTIKPEPFDEFELDDYDNVVPLRRHSKSV